MLSLVETVRDSLGAAGNLLRMMDSANDNEVNISFSHRGWKLHSPPFALASFFAAALLLTLLRKSSLMEEGRQYGKRGQQTFDETHRHLECLTCSTLRLTRFSMYLFPTTLYTMTPTARAVTL